MERPENIKSTNHQLRKQMERETSAIRLVIIFHLVGLLGIHFALTKPVFLLLVPFHLLIMTAIVLFSHDKLDLRFWCFFLAISITGFGVEWIGVHTGQPFGHYSYDKTLGISVSDVPVVMGATWFLLIYGAGVSMRLLRVKSAVLRILGGAVMLVLLDTLMEPVAVKLNYWHWANSSIPLNNYAAWFVISGVLLFVFELFNFKKQSMVGPAILVSQFIFFAALQ